MRKSEFKRRYVSEGGSPNAANSYVAYLNRVDRICGGLDASLQKCGAADLLLWCESQPVAAFGKLKDRSDSLSALRKYINLMSDAPVVQTEVTGAAPEASNRNDKLREVLTRARKLGAEYYQLTGKPLGVTGEVAELAASEALGVELANARQPGFDGWLIRDDARLRVQIKGRAVPHTRRYVGRCPSILCHGQFDICLLVLLDKATLDTIEIWEATETAIASRLQAPGSRARNLRNSLAISQFKSVATRVWSC